jgi:hypothetical protein
VRGASILIAALVSTNAFGQADAIDSCLKRLDPTTDIGYERIAARCPDLTRQLEAGAWSAWLPREWKTPNNDLSAASLKDLRQLAEHELATRAPARAPSLVPLPAILLDLGPMESRRTGLWARFTNWLRIALERQGPSDGHDWWDRTVGRVSVSQTVIDVIGYGCLAAVVAIAVSLVLNELQVAGVFGVGRIRAGGKAGGRVTTRAPSDWTAIESASAGERPRLLLELIAARLVELNRLPPAGAFTVRELLQNAHLPRGDDRSVLADVALAAEKVRFSGEPIPAAHLEAVAERGRQLLEHLGA